MKKNITGGLIFYFSVGITIFVINFLFIIIIGAMRGNDSLSAAYIAEKTLSQVFFLLRNNPPEQVIDDFSEIKSFALYNTEGKVIFSKGDVPKIRDLSFLRSQKPEFDHSRGIITITRPLAVPGRRMDRRFEARANHMPDHAAVFIEVLIDGYNKRRILYIVSLIVIPALSFFLAFYLAWFYHRNEMIRNRLEKSEEMARLGEASRTLAHEIRNPLGAITIQTGILRKMIPDKCSEEISIIEEEADRIKIITDRVGDFLRNGEGKPEVFNVCEYIKQFLARKSENVNVNFQSEVINIKFDIQRFRSVIENLLRNSLESLEEKQSDEPVIISIYRGESGVIISVEDKGIGLSDAERVFDPFYTTKTNGSGIGLSIVKKFVESAGGKILIINNIEGVTVKVALPEV